MRPLTSSSISARPFRPTSCSRRTGNICSAARTATGVSNIFRYELATGEIEALTNAETGFFRPVPTDNGSLLVFRYTGDGFVPSIIDDQPVKDVNPITFLGQQVVEKHPILKQWAAGSPGSVPIESMITRTQKYSPLRRLGLESIYPVVQGYKDVVAYGAHARFSDPVLLNGVGVTATLLAGLVPAAQRTRTRARRLSAIRLERPRRLEQRRLLRSVRPDPDEPSRLRCRHRPHEAPAVRRAAPPDRDDRRTWRAISISCRTTRTCRCVWTACIRWSATCRTRTCARRSATWTTRRASLVARDAQ